MTDRVGAAFPVRQICSSCYNVVYNSACLSLLGTRVMERFAPAGWRLDFTVETKKEVAAVLDALKHKKEVCNPNTSYTKGHLNRGVE